MTRSKVPEALGAQCGGDSPGAAGGFVLGLVKGDNALSETSHTGDRCPPQALAVTRGSFKLVPKQKQIMTRKTRGLGLWGLLRAGPGGQAVLV